MILHKCLRVEFGTSPGYTVLIISKVLKNTLFGYARIAKSIDPLSYNAGISFWACIWFTGSVFLKHDILNQMILNKLKEIEKEIVAFDHDGLADYDVKVSKADTHKISDQLEKVKIKKEALFQTLLKLFENDFHFTVKAAKILKDELIKRSSRSGNEMRGEVDFSEDTMVAHFELEKVGKS